MEDTQIHSPGGSLLPRASCLGGKNRGPPPLLPQVTTVQGTVDHFGEGEAMMFLRSHIINCGIIDTKTDSSVYQLSIAMIMPYNTPTSNLVA